jgi:hypothetical protein
MSPVRLHGLVFNHRGILLYFTLLYWYDSKIVNSGSKASQLYSGDGSNVGWLHLLRLIAVCFAPSWPVTEQYLERDHNRFLVIHLVYHM